MRNARRSVLALAGAATALALALCVLTGAAPPGGATTDIPIRLPGSPALDGTAPSALLDAGVLSRTGSALSRSQLGPITDVKSLERLIQGNDVRAKSTVQELRQIVARDTGVDDRQPAGFGRNVFLEPGVAAGGVVMSSNRAALETADAKVDYDLWAVPMPVAGAGNVYRTTLTSGIRLTTTPGRNEREPVVDSTRSLLAYVAESSPEDEPTPPDETAREDHIFVCSVDGTGVRDITSNFGRVASATVSAPDDDGWDIHSITFAPTIGVGGSIIFATNYGRDASLFKLWIAADPGPGGTAVAQPWAPVPGMDTDDWVYDNPDCDSRGDVLCDTNLNIGGQARRVYLISSGALRPVTDGSKQIVPLGMQQLRDYQPHWAGAGRDITFSSNRVTGGADQAMDVNVWMMTDATAGVNAAEDEQDVLFRLGPIDEISTSQDATGPTSAFQVAGSRYLAEQVDETPGDGDVYLVAYTPNRVSAPAGVSGQPIVNGGVKDLSNGEDLVVEADIRGFPALGFNVEESEVTQVYVVVWRAPDMDLSTEPTWSPAGATLYQPDYDPPRSYPWYQVWPPPPNMSPDDSPWDDTEGTNIGLAYPLANNFYDNLTDNPYQPNIPARDRIQMATFAHLEAVFSLQYQGPSPDAPGYTRWGNATAPFDTSILSEGDKYIGMWLMGTSCLSPSASAPARVMNWEFLYDNISGFTTKPWDPQGATLVVDDYMDGQLFVQQVQNARGDLEHSYRIVGIPVSEHWGHQWTGMVWNDGTSILPVVFSPSDLVEGSNFRNGGNATATPFDRAPADRWRVASRGPITEDVINRYLPELVPYKVSDPALGGDEDRQYRGPFTCTLPTAAGGTVTKSEADLYPGVRGVIWGAPYSGDLFVSEGTITDPNVHETIKQFVDQGGGILVSGQDIAWALTLDGAVQNQFLSTYFGAGYIRDDTGATGVNGPGDRGRYPQLATANPIARPPVPDGYDFWSHGDPGAPDIDPIDVRMATITFTECCSDAATLHSQTFMDDTQQAWPDELQISGADAHIAYNYTGGSGGIAATFLQHQPDVEGMWGGRTAFLGFGLEGLDREYHQWGSPVQAECWLKRNKIVQNFLDWGRTARFDATVTAGSGIPGVPAGTPLADVLVTARPTSGQGSTVYGMLTDSNGYALFRGVPIGSYALKAYAPGLACDHAASIRIWPEATNMSGGEREGFSMSLAPPGTISGTVTDANLLDTDGNPLPLEGIRVVATGWNADGTEAIDPLTRLPITREATTAADGTYKILDVPSQQTYWVVGNPDPRITLIQLNHATDDTTYAVPNLKAVAPSTDTPAVDFSLEAMPGTVSGTVYVAGSNPRQPIANATVRVVGVTPAILTTADESGVYTLPGVPAGSPSIEGSSPGYAPNAITVDVVANETSTLDIPLSRVPPGAISGMVVGSDGTTPLQGVTVQAFFVGQTTASITATTGADGTYLLDPVEVGNYVVKAVDNAGQRSITPADGRSVSVTQGATTANVNFSAVALITWGSGLRMISTPYSYPGATSASVLSIPEADLKLAWWVPILNRYALYPETLVAHITRGRGYFVRLAGNATIDRLGEPSDPTAFSAAFDLPLSEANGGWNMIGNPYTEEVDWYSTKFVYEGQVLSLADAVAQKLVSASLFTYANGGYEVRTVLEPYAGYWAKVEKAGVTARFERPATTASTRSVAARVRNEGVQWSLQLTAEVGGVADRSNFLGVAPTDEGLDSRFDVSEPPSVRSITDRDVSLYFTAGKPGGEVAALASDYRSSLGSASQWSFVVDTNVGDAPVRLSWPDLRSLPRAFTATLEDLSTGKAIAMRGASDYQYIAAPEGESRQFRITVRATGEAAASAPQVLGVDSLARGVTVSYRLQGEADLSIRVLNMAGRVVRTLFTGETRTSGIHSESWDGRDDGGRALPAGEYRLELTAVGADGSIGRATARAVR